MQIAAATSIASAIAIAPGASTSAGIGKRTAERIIVELREKVGAALGDGIVLRRAAAADSPRELAREGLLELGYGAAEQQNVEVALGAALLAGAALPQMQPILANLLESAEQHFRHEERLMRAIHYDGFAWHKHQHDAARKRLKGFAERIDAGESAAVCEMVDFFRLWLRDHTGLHDRMMAAYLRNFGRAHAQSAS